MNRAILILIVVVSTQSHADWLCRSQASKMEGPDAVVVCGVGSDLNEVKARIKAREAAFEEFQALVKASTAQNRDYRIEPMRMECKNQTCYRAFRFHLGQKKSNTQLDRRVLEYQLRRMPASQEARRLELETKLRDSDYAWKDHDRHYTLGFNVGYLSIPTTFETLDDGFATIGINFEYKPFRLLGFDFEASSLGGAEDTTGSALGAYAKVYGWRGLNAVAGYRSINVSNEVTGETADLSGFTYGLGWNSKADSKGLAVEVQALYHGVSDQIQGEDGLSLRLGFSFGF